MLFLRLDQALELLRTCKTLKETLAIRYFAFNGLSPMEVADARIEHLDPVTHHLFLPRRHWKKNCVASIDAETVRLQIIHSGSRKKGPLLRSRKTKGHYTPRGLWRLVKAVAARTMIPDKHLVTPLVLKRTFAREWLMPAEEEQVECPHCGGIFPYKCKGGGTVASLQQQFSHLHLWSTERYLRLVIEDARRNHTRMMERIEGGKAKLVRSVPR